MKILGLIVEFNPFHTGHQYFLDEARRITSCDVVLAVTTTSFTMRGEIAMMNKVAKTQLMLAKGIDIVMELPVARTLQRADIYAYHNVKILSTMGVTDIVCGAEIADMDLIVELAKWINDPKFQEQLTNECQSLASDAKAYKTIFSFCLQSVGCPNELIAAIEMPNTALALYYYNAIQQINPQINFHLIKRDSAHHNNLIMDSNHPSSTAIRQAQKSGAAFSHLLGFDLHVFPLVNLENAQNNELLLLKYLFTNQTIDFNRIYGFQEGIENYIAKSINEATTYEELLALLANKRYTKTRFSRLFAALLLQIPSDLTDTEPYLRILGFSANGEQYIGTLPKATKLLLLTNLKHMTNLDAALELKATKIYSILTANPELVQQEYQFPLKK